MTILYLTQNGIAEHIGQSQVAPYLLGLAARGFDIHLVSAEKPGRDDLKAAYRARFAAAGIRWTTIAYHNRPPVLGQLRDLAAFLRVALAIARRERITLIHSRSHPPMLVAMAVKRWTGARLIFDFRDFWADSNLAHGRFKPLFRWFKRRERDFIAAADAVVTLTARAAEHLAAAYADPTTKYTVIPCCADFAHFHPLDSRIATRAELGIPADATVLLYLGSIGAVYLVPEMMALFAELRRLRPGAVFLLVCNNGREEVLAAAARAGVPAESLRITSAPRARVPYLIGAADLSVAFKRADLSNLGCSPIKIGEAFACGVPVIANAGVGDLDQLLAPARNGSLALLDFAPETMRTALEQVLASDRPDPQAIRENSRDLSLEAGIARYAMLYEALGERPARAG